ncbi:hypothetical protein [Corynebacterium frankenforstense]
MTTAYGSMHAHPTPIPTPPVVRLGTSALFGLAVAVLTTPLPRGAQVAVMIAAVAAGCLLTFSHPYRREMRTFLDKRGIEARPRLGQVLPLFLVWLALMLAPLLAPAATWVTLVAFLVVFGWMFWVFPHVDGTRALAFADPED